MALALACIVVAGCTDPGDEPDPQPSAGASPSATPTRTAPLSVLIYGDKRKVAAYERIAADFEAGEGGVPVKLQVYDDAASAADAALTGLEGGFAPDVFLLDHEYLAQFVDPPYLEPLDGPLEEQGLQFGDDFQRVALTALSANSGLQCMPAEISPLVVYWNRGLVPRDYLEAQEVQFPDGAEGWSWEDFEAAARAVAVVDELGPIKGAYVPSDLETVTAFVRSAGGDVVDDEVEPTRLDLASDEAVETIRTLATFTRDPTLSPTARQLEKKPALEWFADGDLGMYIGTRVDLPRLRTEPGLRFDVVPLPGFGTGQSVSMINGWCVNAESENTDAAIDFISYAVGREGATTAARSVAIVPSRVDVVNSRAFLQPNAQPRSGEVYGASVRRSAPMPFAPGWPAVNRGADIVLQRVMTNPFVDIEGDRLTRRLERLDTASEAVLSPEEE